MRATSFTRAVCGTGHLTQGRTYGLTRIPYPIARQHPEGSKATCAVIKGSGRPAHRSAQQIAGHHEKVLTSTTVGGITSPLGS